MTHSRNAIPLPTFEPLVLFSRSPEDGSSSLCPSEKSYSPESESPLASTPMAGSKNRNQFTVSRACKPVCHQLEDFSPKRHRRNLRQALQFSNGPAPKKIFRPDLDQATQEAVHKDAKLQQDYEAKEKLWQTTTATQKDHHIMLKMLFAEGLRYSKVHYQRCLTKSRILDILAKLQVWMTDPKADVYATALNEISCMRAFVAPPGFKPAGPRRSARASPVVGFIASSDEQGQFSVPSSVTATELGNSLALAKKLRNAQFSTSQFSTSPVKETLTVTSTATLGYGTLQHLWRRV